MNLIDELTPLLEHHLPEGSANAIKAPELIRRVQPQTDAADSSLRFAFCQMSKDQSSPIAKVDMGQGYYLRPPSQRSVPAGEVSRLRELGAMALQFRDHYRNGGQFNPAWHAKAEALCNVADKLQEGAE